MNSNYDVIVIGGGHAGCEAALACSRLGFPTLMITINKDKIAQMSCNPSIGGLAKSQLTREIDALGGQMAKAADAAAIQSRILNTKKGYAVQAYRAQADKYKYMAYMQEALAASPNLQILENMAVDLIIKNNQITGIITEKNGAFSCKKLIITTGTFLNGYIHRGLSGYDGGREGDPASKKLSTSLSQAGITLGRLKTGTPARLDKNSINFEKTEPQYSDPEPIYFSFEKPQTTLPHIPCHITYTNEHTHNIIKNNLAKSALYGGIIVGIGPRYCPSIEDKVVKFPEKTRHQIFLEPEGLDTNEIYIGGLSNSLPADIQLEIIHSIAGLENAQVIRYAYAIEYDFVYTNQIKTSLECKKIKNLYLAGQINGTSGYEEAAAQGLIAGINASLSLREQNPLILNRDQAYIGVLLDDLVTKMPTEPYRMFTSHAEYRLLLRNDNADLRLTDIGYKIGLISQKRYDLFLEKKEIIEKEIKWLKNIKNKKLISILTSGDGVDYNFILEKQKRNLNSISDEIKKAITIQVQYEGYIAKQEKMIATTKKLEAKKIPQNINYKNIKNLKKEAREKLIKIMPESIGQASRIAGVTPADITTLLIYLQKG